jgi:hypothetical protein
MLFGVVDREIKSGKKGCLKSCGNQFEWHRIKKRLHGN